jgi:DNA-binding transcriptional regulator YbjK
MQSMHAARTRILRVTSDLVRAHGFKAIRRRHVAESCDVAPSLINYYFGGCMAGLRIEVMALAETNGDAKILAHAIKAGIYHLPRRMTEKLEGKIQRALRRIERQCLT